jgi:hypothetical protein
MILNHIFSGMVLLEVVAYNSFKRVFDEFNITNDFAGGFALTLGD